MKPVRRGALALWVGLILEAAIAIPAVGPATGPAIIVAAPRPKPTATASPTPAPTSITWSGKTWSVKTSSSPVGPGPNLFRAENVAVDDAGYLHLAITAPSRNKWTTAEIVGPSTMHGYGTYTWVLGSPLNALDKNVVLGLFTWSDAPDYAHRELDIEFARWSNLSDPTNAQYVVQPYGTTDHLRRFTQPDTSTSTHSFTWAPGSVSWESRDATGGVVASYSYTGTDVPVPGDEQVRLNLWLYQGRAPSDGRPVELIVRSFAFTPAP